MYGARHMVGVVTIAVVFTGLSVAIAWGATRGRLGGLTNALETQSPIGRKVMNSVLVFFFVGFGIVAPVVFLVGNRDRASAQVGGIKLNAMEKQGRTLFGEHCAVCHTLAAASAVGKTGPNLDQLKPPVDLILHTIQNGCLQQPAGNEAQQTCLGYGTMPADVVQGRDAVDVAHFVAKVAGHS
jgi:mono/diheme cytochrome c family protein